MGKKRTLYLLAKWLVLIGALNWGLTLFGFNLVGTVVTLSTFAWMATIVYGAIGVSSAWLILQELNIIK